MVWSLVGEGGLELAAMGSVNTDRVWWSRLLGNRVGNETIAHRLTFASSGHSFKLGFRR